MSWVSLRNALCLTAVVLAGVTWGRGRGIAAQLPQVDLVLPDTAHVLVDSETARRVEAIAASEGWRLTHRATDGQHVKLFYRASSSRSVPVTLSNALGMRVRVCAPPQVTLMTETSPQPSRCAVLAPGDALREMLPGPGFYLNQAARFVIVLLSYVITGLWVPSRVTPRFAEPAVNVVSLLFLLGWVGVHLDLFVSGKFSTFLYGLGPAAGIGFLFLFDVVLGQAAIALVHIRAKRIGRARPQVRLGALLAVQSSHAVAAAVTPAIVMAGLLVNPGWVIDMVGEPLHFAGLLILGYVAAGVLFPWVLARFSGGTPQADPAWQALREQGRTRGVRQEPIVVRGTGVANAIVAGVFRPSVFVTAELLDISDERLRQAIYLHELGHVHLHHTWKMLAWIVGASLLAGQVARWVQLAGGVDAVYLMAGLYGIGIVAVGWLARRYELEADAFAARLVGAETVIEAIETTVRFNGLSPGLGLFSFHPPPSARREALTRLGRARGAG